MVENIQINAPNIEIVSKCANSFPNFFFPHKFGKFLFAISRDFLTKYSFLFSVVKILLNFSKEKTLAGSAINGTN
jgi:hypothetical protein